MDLIDCLKVYQFDNKIRLGVNHDGGYVIANNIGNYDCYISAGVADEESFSRDFIEKFNMNKYNSYAFDRTIKNYPYQYTNRITFIPKNIGNVFDSKTANLSSLTNFVRIWGTFFDGTFWQSLPYVDVLNYLVELHDFLW